MGWVSALAIVFCATTSLLHLVSTFLAANRFRNKGGPVAQIGRDPVTIIRPVRGLDEYDELTLRSSFELHYPNYELIFCCEDVDDAAVAVVNRLMAAYPKIRARLLIGANKTTANPKLNNLIKGWDAAASDWVILADCNVLLPHDCIDRLLRAWRPRTGVLCSPPAGCMAKGFWAELECAFLNTFQLRWQYTADSVGLGFAQGKMMLWRRRYLNEAGGIRALGAEIAEDIAATKIVRRQRHRVRLVDHPFEQPLGYRTPAQVWDRQVRWARLRRATFPWFFIPEFFAGSFFPILSGTFAAESLGGTPSLALLSLVGLWLGTEAVLSRLARWHFTAYSPIAWALRDLTLPILWFHACCGDSFVWRGNEMTVTSTPLRRDAHGEFFENWLRVRDPEEGGGADQEGEAGPAAGVAEHQREAWKQLQARASP